MKWGKIMIYVLIVLALIGVCGFIIYFTGGFTTDFTGFYVTVDGEDVLSMGNNFKISESDPMHVQVKYVFSSPNDTTKGYSVKVVPNPIKDKDFDFSINGDLYSYQAEKDLTDGFVIKQEDTGFTFAPKGNLSAILAAVYPDSTVSDCENKGYENMFTLVVTSYNGEAEVRINFTVTEDIQGVILDKEVIEF
ncbi:MAG: hypothetical protein II330_08215 [Clostridia bacterium]|nr:hypothetical protein [Clostridia bacterium]MBQ2256835.1 hypothetical protein [Clostridia bacterium]